MLRLRFREFLYNVGILARFSGTRTAYILKVYYESFYFFCRYSSLRININVLPNNLKCKNLSKFAYSRFKKSHPKGNV